MRVPNPLCTCGHEQLEHWDGRLQCFDGLIGHCAEFDPAPGNDDREGND